MKIVRIQDSKHVKYSSEHWKLLRSLRAYALRIMKILLNSGLDPIVHGSIARGDVHKNSDIDIVIPYYTNPFLIENALDMAGISLLKKEIVQATPRHAIKASIYIDERTVVTFPLSKLSRLEREFYRFSGEINSDDLEKNLRVPGVNKKLLAIIPVEDGHIEFSIIGREHEVAEILKVSIDIVKEREYILTRRDEKGRTGVFVHKELPPDMSIAEAALKIARQNFMFRKQLII